MQLFPNNKSKIRICKNYIMFKTQFVRSCKSKSCLLKKTKFGFRQDQIMTARGNLFMKDKKGLIPTIVESYYNERSVIKKNQLKAEQKLVKTDKSDKHAVYQLEKEIATFGNQQMAIKILMNSLYGAISNEFFRYFDQRIAESITMCGQFTIRWAEQKINDYMNKILKTEGEDYVVAIDTDSLYIRMGDLVSAVEPRDPVSFLNKVATEKIEPLQRQTLTRHLIIYLVRHVILHKKVRNTIPGLYEQAFVVG